MKKYNLNPEILMDKFKDPVIVKAAAIVFILLLAVFLIFLKSQNRETNKIIIEGDEDITTAETKEFASDIYVDIDGEVKKPGVYKVKNGTRLFEVIELAGGLTDSADPETVNRAKSVEDGQKIIIPNIKERELNSNGSGLINLNLASKSDLETLPGIGPVTADTIIKYREENNGFHSKDEIMNISGIGSVTYGKIKDLITL